MDATATGEAFRWSFESPEWNEEIASRLLGCMLISVLPAEGLWETVVDLRSTYEYLLEDRALARRHAHPEPRAIRGELRHLGEPPQFALDE